jgi:serine/threonine protein kinase/tetratricopeptide (TPR) repeat protein
MIRPNVAILEPQFHGTPRFRIVSRIGVGAIGELYKAMDETRGTFVALRTLRNVPSDAGDRLKRDFRALKAVRHPSLVSLGELDCADGLWFYTMEFVEGESLIDYVRPRPNAQVLGMGAPGELNEVRLRSALSQLVRGIAALHQAGRVHGSIEPDHLRVTAQGRLVILECELKGAREDGGSDQRLIGALPFVAPERLEDAPMSSAADWYSVGAVLFHALAGVPPFSASGADLVEQKQRAVPELPNVRSTLKDLASLCQELLSIDPDGRPEYDEVREHLGINSETESRISQTFSLLGDAPPFVGRKRELGLLAEAFERTRHGAVSTLCLHGETGLGKRTLATQLVRKLRNDYPHLVHLSGRCEPDGPRAFRAVSGMVDSLSRYLATQDASSVATLLPPDTGLLSRLFPSMMRVPLPEGSTRVPQEPPAQRRTALRALRTLLRDLSKRHPLLIVLEDVQWADADALSVIEELIRPPNAPDMLLLLIVDGELRGADPPLRSWLTRYEDQITMMRLRELGEPASRELAERLLESGGLPDAHASEQVANAGRGHPLRIDALARHYLLTSVLAPSHLTLDDLLWSRVEHLPLDARQLLITLCHARVPLPAEIAAEAAGLSTEGIGRHIAVLRVANLGRTVREADGERHAPSHRAVRDAVFARADVDHARMHRQIALTLSGWSKAPKDVLATHWRDAQNMDRAARATSRAADAARDMLAFDAAVRLYQEALGYEGIEDDEDRRLRTELAHAYASAGQSERAARAYIEAARYASPADALELERRAAHQLLRTGHITDGLRTVENVLARLDVHLPASENASLLSLFWHRLRLSVRGQSFQERDASQIPPTDLMRADILGSLAAALGMIDTVRGADVQTRYLLLALKLGDPVRVARALSLEAGYQAYTSEANDTGYLETLERAESLAQRTQDSQARGFALTVRATATFLRGAFRENMQVSLDAERVLSTECTDVDWEIGNTRVYRALSQVYLGELKQSAERVAEQIREAKERGDQYAYTNLRVAVGYLPLLMANEPASAMGLLDEAISSWTHKGFHMQHFFHLLGSAQAELYARTGKPYLRVLSLWPALSRSFLLRVSMVAHTVRQLRARAAIMQASIDRTDRELLLRDAADSGEKLADARVPYAMGWGFAIRAGVDALRGHQERAVQRLEQAEAAFYESEMNLYAAATRFQLGRLIGGERGRELKLRAEEWLEAQGVRKPDAFVGMLLPGFD